MTGGGRSLRGRAAYSGGLEAEHRAAVILGDLGFTVLARRLRTPVGEIDLIAVDPALLLIVEIKRRPTLRDAAYALTVRQSQRLLSAADYVLGAHPEWHRDSIRIDVIIFDAAMRARRIQDALRIS
ncbi:YraN family protein [Brytella acorum]|uniref:UPF0102 protein LMG32879_001433 n=1 Tax=Brytella acorum TaxID=2959299 RepID=A0AA35XW94_9PROT|nr:YraN family protein [Brytella acorum]MDF3624070.1 YraN family protein [Brytella acorum]CAI9120599.1 YraN family protein [Brytella acorum]